MRVLVTGAAGFIGGHLLQRLVEQDIPTTALGSLSATRSPPAGLQRPPLTWVRADACDVDAMTALLRGHSAVIHLAGRYPLFGAPADAIAYVHANTVATAVMLVACERAEVQRFVLASSAQVYGRPDRLPIHESQALNGATAYAASKLGAETLVRAHAAGHGLEGLSLRLFNVYGPRQPASNVIATVAGQALAGGPVSIHSAHPERDFVYVGDVVDALLAAMHCPIADGRAVNIASGTSVNVGDVAKRILRLAGRPAEALRIRHGECASTATNPDCVRADVRRAQDLLGWTPTTSLDDGLAHTLDWMRRHPASSQETHPA